MPPVENSYRLTKKQDVAFEHLTSIESCSILYGGAKRRWKIYAFMPLDLLLGKAFN